MSNDVMNSLVGLKYAKYNTYVDWDKEASETILAYLQSHAEKQVERGVTPTLFWSDFCYDPHSNVITNHIIRHSAVLYHNHDFVEINYALRGCIAETVNGTPVLIKENQLLILMPDAFHSCYPCQNAQGYNILLRQDWLKRFCSKLSDGRSDSLLCQPDFRKGWHLFEAVQTEAKEYLSKLLQLADRADGAFVEKEALTVLSLLHLSPADKAEPESAHESKRKSVDAGEILRYISQNYTTATLSQTAAHFGYSPAHLHRIIQKQTGNGFSVFLLSARMSKAAYLLSETQIPIYRIAEMLGLSGSEYFSRMFKKYAGVSPREYRKGYAKDYEFPKNTPVIQTENAVQKASVIKAAGKA